jgi:hypothetical protein
MQAKRMKSLPGILLLLLLAVVSIAAVAQVPSGSQDPVYGFDPFLYNGRMYYFSPQPGTLGTQYLSGEFDSRGSVTVKGVTYANLVLNYDLYNQQLIMEYRNSLGSSCLVAISDAWLESFTLGGSYFEIVTEANADKRIYQVLGKGPAKVMYYRNRELLIDNMKSSKNHYFSTIRIKKYLQIQGNLTSYYTNWNFVKAFNPGIQNLIKKYIRNHSINVKEASDFSMTDLINYCNTLPGL